VIWIVTENAKIDNAVQFSNVFDLHFFTEGDAEAVISQFHQAENHSNLL
jgi:hypothetical protein